MAAKGSPSYVYTCNIYIYIYIRDEVFDLLILGVQGPLAFCGEHRLHTNVILLKSITKEKYHTRLEENIQREYQRGNYRCMSS